MLDATLRSCIKRMYRVARQRGYEYISVDQLALAVLAAEDVRAKLRDYDVCPDRYAQMLMYYINELTPRLPLAREGRYPRLTTDLRRIMTFCFGLYAARARQCVGAAQLLPAVMMSRNSTAAQGLRGMGLGPERLNGTDAELAQMFGEVCAGAITAAAEIEPLPGAPSPEHDADAAAQADDEPDAGPLAIPLRISRHGSSETAIYVEFRRDDSTGAAADESGPLTTTGDGDEAILSTPGRTSPDNAVQRELVGRVSELLSICRILLRKQKNNVLLIGESGVGKTALIRHLVNRGQNEANAADSALRRFRWHQLNHQRLLSAMRQRGSLEREFDRLRGGDNLHPVLVIDNFGELVGTGSQQRGSDEIVRLLLSAVDQPDLRVAGACSYKELHILLEHHPSLMRRFQTVDIEEPDREQTLDILRSLRGEYESYHGVRYSARTLTHILACADRFDVNRYYPEKAVDLMDEVGAFLRTRTDDSATVTEEIIERVARQRARIDSTSSVSLNPVQDLDKNLSQHIFSQDHAIAELVKTLKISFSELHDSQRMRGCFLFVGPTGVGKTELTRRLAEAMNMPLHRYDMSEFAERHSTARLIGAPPGYVGFEGGGQLVSDVRKAPHSVILLDELEKAHGDVLNLLLQMMDYATLTSSSGALTRFHHCILVATTNAGAAEVSRTRPGFIEQDSSPEYKQQLQKSFSPEFLNRFDSIVCFNPLSRDDLMPMAEKLLVQLNQSLAARKLVLSFSAECVSWLCTKAWDSKQGARPLARFFQEQVKLPVADFISAGAPAAGGTVKVQVRNDALVFQWPQATVAAKKIPSKRRARQGPRTSKDKAPSASK